MPNVGKPTNGNQSKAKASSANAKPDETAKLIARVRREGFKGDAVIAEVARRFAQFSVTRSPNRNGIGIRGENYEKPKKRFEPHAVMEHAGHLARKVLKFFPFHTSTVPPVDYDAGADTDVGNLVPYEQSAIQTITVPDGTSIIMYFSPSTASAGRYCIFDSTKMDTTFFDQTNTTWPFTGTIDVPLQALYPIRNPPGIRPDFGAWGALGWAQNANTGVLGAGTGVGDDDITNPKIFLSGGVVIDAYVGYTGTAPLHWCGPSDNPTQYGPTRPDIIRQIWGSGVRQSLFYRSDTGANASVNGTIPAQLTEMAEIALAGLHPAYAPPPSIPMTSTFTPRSLLNFGKTTVLQGGGEEHHKSVGWTFHCEDTMLSTQSYASVPYGDPRSFMGWGANPTHTFMRGQGWFMATASGADLTLQVRVNCHWAGGAIGASGALQTQLQHVQIFNDDSRDDSDEHANHPHAHESVLGDTAQEVLEGAGVAGLVKAGLSTNAAKQVGSIITSRAPTAVKAARTVLSTGESALSFLTTHLGNAAKSILPKVLTVGEDVAEAAAFL